ncbi:MAG TPA: nucleotidyltransferase family protein, partial [Syntrophorhabdaceae bacterium]|nr:nucleotidyltransferase family protein [Syntrophorhabdaceae bacterium]
KLMVDGIKTVILAGGKGSRLHDVVKDIPKPMAPVMKKPFLEYIILQICRWGIKEIIISVGYKKEVIREYFADGRKWGVDIVYCVEDEPLGTAGAIRKAILSSNANRYIAMNGDSFFDIDINRLIRYHEEKKAVFTIGLVHVEDTGRFGKVLTRDNGEVFEFIEKGCNGRGNINGGIYVFERDIVDFIPEGICSLENDVLPKLVSKGLYGMETKTYFIDIGIPKEYESLFNDPQQLYGRI